MQFDVIIGNPPYQMKGGAGGTSDSSIYLFSFSRHSTLNLGMPFSSRPRGGWQADVGSMSSARRCSAHINF